VKRTFIIADIHGCNKTLRALVEEKIVPSKEDSFIFLGDYIDRGPNTKEVIDYLISIKQTYRNSVFLRGNHEQMFLDSSISYTAYDRWYINGGKEVILSYGLKNHDETPYYLQEFISATDYYFQDEQNIFVHAGLNHLADDPLKDYNAMMWIRDFQVSKQLTGGRVVIHGHTPTPLPEIQNQIEKSSENMRICLDNGCVYKNRHEDLGNLLALELPSRKLFIQPNIDY
jgi:serine/threonine protein phosphatase 1